MPRFFILSAILLNLAVIPCFGLNKESGDESLIIAKRYISTCGEYKIQGVLNQRSESFHLIVFKDSLSAFELELAGPKMQDLEGEFVEIIAQFDGQIAPSGHLKLTRKRMRRFTSGKMNLDATNPVQILNSSRCDKKR